MTTGFFLPNISMIGPVTISQAMTKNSEYIPMVPITPPISFGGTS